MSSLAALDACSRTSSFKVDLLGALSGRIVARNGPRAVVVGYNDAPWATVPTVETLPNTHDFMCDLPPVAEASDGFITVHDAQTGELLTQMTVQDRQRRLNDFGVSARDMLAIHGRPFFAVPYIRFDGAKLTLVGSHLPPGGDPSQLGVEFGSGVSYDFQYPLKSPSWENHFWFWPNARFSDFILTIDLPSCAPGSDPFHFRFVYPSGAVQPAHPLEGDYAAPYGDVWIPRDLGSYIGFPRDGAQLTRVQTWSDSNSVTMTGYNAFKVMEALLLRYNIRPEAGVSILDWGCGHGRVTRHFINAWPAAEIIGMDVDAENVVWCQENLLGGRFVTTPLMPQSPLADSRVSAIFSISVMTHLSPPVQQVWLQELARVLKPNGLALISFGGPGAVAWSSVWNKPDYYAKWNATGFHADVADNALSGKIDDNEYYRNVAQRWDYTAQLWSSHFEIIAIHPEAIGNLDFAVMRKKSANHDGNSAKKISLWRKTRRAFASRSGQNL